MYVCVGMFVCVCVCVYFVMYPFSCHPCKKSWHQLYTLSALEILPVDMTWGKERGPWCPATLSMNPGSITRWLTLGKTILCLLVHSSLHLSVLSASLPVSCSQAFTVLLYSMLDAGDLGSIFPSIKYRYCSILRSIVMRIQLANACEET